LKLAHTKYLISSLENKYDVQVTINFFKVIVTLVYRHRFWVEYSD
jgi:hypothetical protein